MCASLLYFLELYLLNTTVAAKLLLIQVESNGNWNKGKVYRRSYPSSQFKNDVHIHPLSFKMSFIK